MPRSLSTLARFAALAIVIWGVNFGLFVYFFRVLTSELLSEYWKSEQVGYIFGPVLIGYGLAAAFLAALFAPVARFVRR